MLLKNMLFFSSSWKCALFEFFSQLGSIIVSFISQTLFYPYFFLSSIFFSTLHYTSKFLIRFFLFSSNKLYVCSVCFALLQTKFFFDASGKNRSKQHRRCAKKNFPFTISASSKKQKKANGFF